MYPIIIPTLSVATHGHNYLVSSYSSTNYITKKIHTHRSCKLTQFKTKNTRSVASVSEGSFFILTPCMLLLLWYKKGAWNNTTTWSGCCYNHINVEETSKNNNLPESSRGLASFISTSESASRLSSGFSLSSSCCMKQEHRLVIIWWIIYLLHEEPPGHISHHSGSQMGWTFCSILHLYTPWNCISCWVAFEFCVVFFNFWVLCFLWLHFMIGWICCCRYV